MNRSSLEPVGTLSARPYALPPSIMMLVVVLALGWGSNRPVMKVVMTEMAPLHFRALCLIAGATGLFATAQANRLPIRVPKGSWPRLVAIAAPAVERFRRARPRSRGTCGRAHAATPSGL